MNCETFETGIDDYLDGALDVTAAAGFDAHLAGCADCRARLEHARRCIAAVADYGRNDIAMPEPAWFDVALAKAAWQGSRRERRRRWAAAGTVAAGLAVWLFAALLGGTGDLPVADAGVPAVAMTLEQPRTVRLVFNSPVELADATLTVSLPDGLELAGFAGQREITWSTSLSAGKNVLALELIATSPLSGDVLATLRHADEQKTFRLRVDVNQDASLPLGQKMEIIA